MELIPFINLAAQRRRIERDMKRRVEQVLTSNAYILGAPVRELEALLAERAGVRHAVACASGTDALLVPLIEQGIGPGDVVFIPTFTFISTAEVVAMRGAIPWFVDVRPSDFLMCPEKLADAIQAARAANLRPAAAIPVDLYGKPADDPELWGQFAKEGLFVIADAAQSFGAVTRNGQSVGGLGDVTGTSFYPSKPLGCYGDGGAMFTNDDDRAAHLRTIAAHGIAPNGVVTRVGINSRLDSVQAAVLLAKLAIFDEELVKRDAIALRYHDVLDEMNGTSGSGEPFLLPERVTSGRSAWALYTIRLPSQDRDAIVTTLQQHGIPTAVHYRIPLHLQPAFASYPRTNCSTAERLAGEVLCLPMHPYLETATQDRIADVFLSSLRGARAA